MAKKAYIEGDLVLRVEEDIDQELQPVPPSYENLGAARLRWDEAADPDPAVVDANDYTSFFIATDGVKHIQNLDPDGVALTPDTESIEIQRRAALNDRVLRTTGSFITDGFKVGQWLTIEGSASSDGVYKLITVAALEMETDEDISRPQDEAATTGVTLHGGWQKIAAAFADVLEKDADGLWGIKSDSSLQADDEATYNRRIERAASRHVEDSWDTSGKLKEDGETQAAFAKIVAAGNDTADSLHTDMSRVADRIYDEEAHSLTGVDLTFDATARTITRASGDFTADGWSRYALCSVSGSTSNNGSLAIKAVGTDTITVSDSGLDDLVNEGPASGITLSAVAAITGYKRAIGTNTVQREIIMRRGIVNRWIDEVRAIEKTALGDINASTLWVTSTAYAIGDSVWLKSARKFYVCNDAHTSSPDFATDVAKWDLINAQTLPFPAFPTTQLES